METPKINFHHPSRRLAIAVSGVSMIAGALVRAEDPPSPARVSAQTISAGREIFHGPGRCYRCHGKNGQGTFFAPALNDAQHLHLQTGSIEEIANLVLSGVPEPKRFSIAMPPRGGAPLTREDVFAVAAYVYSIDRAH